MARSKNCSFSNSAMRTRYASAYAFSFAACSRNEWKSRLRISRAVAGSGWLMRAISLVWGRDMPGSAGSSMISTMVPS
ncbi:hypothetical protein ACLB2K_016046 [Fragaria x ananassa]